MTLHGNLHFPAAPDGGTTQSQCGGNQGSVSLSWPDRMPFQTLPWLGLEPRQLDSSLPPSPGSSSIFALHFSLQLHQSPSDFFNTWSGMLDRDKPGTRSYLWRNFVPSTMLGMIKGHRGFCPAGSHRATSLLLLIFGPRETALCLPSPSCPTTNSLKAWGNKIMME